MQKEEFEEWIGDQINDSDYELIEFVYQFHPVVSETSGKEEVAELYKSFGITIFLDMLSRAKKNYELTKELQIAKIKVSEIQDRMEELKHEILPEGEQYHPDTADADEKLRQNIEIERKMMTEPGAFGVYV